MSKVRLATVWLDGCSGCHMSFLDMDERILEIAARVEVVYSPLVDLKEFPADVDVTIVEGGVSSEEDLHKIRMVRSRTKLLIALGDCAVTSNVPGMRNNDIADECSGPGKVAGPVGDESLLRVVALDDIFHVLRVVGDKIRFQGRLCDASAESSVPFTRPYFGETG